MTLNPTPADGHHPAVAQPEPSPTTPVWPPYAQVPQPEYVPSPASVYGPAAAPYATAPAVVPPSSWQAPGSASPPPVAGADGGEGAPRWTGQSPTTESAAGSGGEARKSLPAWQIAAGISAAVALFGSGWLGGTVSAHLPSRSGSAASTTAGGSAEKSAAVARLQTAQSTCDSTHRGTTLADNGYTLTIDGAGDEDYGGLLETDLQCVFGALGMPEAVNAHIGQTRALDGRQEDSWGSFSASWTFHPDAGFDGVIRVV